MRQLLLVALTLAAGQAEARPGRSAPHDDPAASALWREVIEPHGVEVAALLARARAAMSKLSESADLTAERALTNNEFVNWGPFWHPDAKHIIYATSRHGHQNYELYLMNVDTGREERITGGLAEGIARARLPLDVTPTHEDLQVDRILGAPARELAILEHGHLGEIYHLSPDHGLEVREVVQTICRLLDKRFEDAAVAVGERPGQDAAYVIDSTRARKELGWAPVVSFQQGLAEVVAWVDEYWDEIGREALVYEHKA